MKKIVVPIKGMHCRSCEIMLTDKLESLPDVVKADVSMRSKSAVITAKHSPSEAAIARAVEDAGYEVGTEKIDWFSKNFADYRDVIIGIVLVAAIALLLGAFNLDQLSTGNIVTGGIIVAVIVGLTAGFSTCMALVGGLVLGLSARYAEKHPDESSINKFKPHLFFNASRIVAFFIFGGAIGLLGSAFHLSGPLLGILTILVGVVMLMLGLQLTHLFPKLSNGGLSLPSGLTRRLGIQEKANGEYTNRSAIYLGVVSFFLPCGFTQAMQLYAISTGSFSTGALVMGLFAIGTTPGLLAIGGLTSTIEGGAAKRFFKIAGVAVVAMAFVNIVNGYNLTGWPKPLSDSADVAQSSTQEITSTPLTGPVEQAEPLNDAKDEKVLRATYTLASGMVPSEFSVKAGQEYILEVNAMEDGVGCMSTILIPGLNNNVQYLLGGKTNKLAFKAKKTGTYQVTCAMGVPHGTITVI